MSRHSVDELFKDHPLLDHMATSLVLLDANLSIAYLNPAAEELLQISDSRALHRHLDEVMFIDDALVPRLNICLRDNHPFAEHEVIALLPGSRKVHIDYSAHPVMLDDQRFLLMEISPMDRHVRIAREEKILQDQLATRNLIRGMAHEIKNPLGGLRGAAQLLERELTSDDQKEYTRIIISEADRLQNLVDRMLGPRVVPRMEMVNIHQLTEHVRQLVEVETDYCLHFHLDYDPSLPEVYVDPELLIQVILNITRNAASVLGDAGEISYRTRPVRHFTIGQKSHRLVMQLDIIDNGPGIPEDIRDQIFFPMVTGRAEGTGLGLSIAQNLINLHGGLIECESRPGQTRFSIFLPLEKQDV